MSFIDMSLKNIKRFFKNISSLKSITFDCDGILIIGERRANHPFIDRPIEKSDLLGLQKLIETKLFIISAITKSRNPKLKTYLHSLGFDHIYLGADDKLLAYEELKTIYELHDSECCHIGDGEADLPLLNKVGFSVTVPHASVALKEAADYCTEHEGGWGAVAELCALIIDCKQGH